MDERDVDGTQAGDGSGAASVDVERLREIKLMGFLRELDRQEGRMATAALLGVNYKTVARALDEDRVTGRMADALELLLGAGSDTEMERLRRQVRLLAERVAALEERGDGPTLPPVAGEGRDDVPGESHGDGGGERKQTAATTGDGHGDALSQSPPEAPPPVQGLNRARPARHRRVDPDMVTREPAEDDPEVYGDAWASGGRVAGAEGQAPRPGPEPVLADRPRAAAGDGAGHAGGARADPAAGEAAGAGPGPAGPHPLALEGAVPNPGGHPAAQAAVLAAPVAHPGDLVELGRLPRAGAGAGVVAMWSSRGGEPPANAWQAITDGVGQSLAKSVPCHRGTGDNHFSLRLFPVFPARKLEGPVLGPGNDRIGSSPALRTAAPAGLTQKD